MDSDAPIVDLLELGAPADPFGGAKYLGFQLSAVNSQLRAPVYSLLTVSRFRPFARRRFNTNRPFFVLIRTRNPCVRLRRRVFG